MKQNFLIKIIQTSSLLMLLTFAAMAHADNAGSAGTSLEWEKPLEVIEQSLSGPVAKSVAVIAMIICGMMLMSGAEFSDIIKKIVQVVLVLSLLLFAGSFVTTLFSGGDLIQQTVPPPDQEIRTIDDA